MTGTLAVELPKSLDVVERNGGLARVAGCLAFTAFTPLR